MLAWQDFAFGKSHEFRLQLGFPNVKFLRDSNGASQCLQDQALMQKPQLLRNLLDFQRLNRLKIDA